MAHEIYLSFDIETMAVDWELLSESQQEYITRGANTEEEIAKKKGEMALSPLTSRVICIGMQMTQFDDSHGFEILNKAAFALDNDIPYSEKKEKILSNGDKCYLYNEKRMLDDFWKILKKYDNAHLISFNGRNFDAPFLMLRSAVLGIRPSRNLMSGTKYYYQNHTDLIDELTFYTPSNYGATRRYNFDFYTRAFGITSPKSQGIDGSKVGDFFRQGRILEIAEYCLRDVTATWELFVKWKEFLKF